MTYLFQNLLSKKYLFSFGQDFSPSKIHLSLRNPFSGQSQRFENHYLDCSLSNLQIKFLRTKMELTKMRGCRKQLPPIYYVYLFWVGILHLHWITYFDTSQLHLKGLHFNFIETDHQHNMSSTENNKMINSFS